MGMEGDSAKVVLIALIYHACETDIRCLSSLVLFSRRSGDRKGASERETFKPPAIARADIKFSTVIDLRSRSTYRYVGQYRYVHVDST